jgi:uncharacterized protein
MDIMDIIFRVALGLVIGFCIGLTGVGGGVLVLPALTLLLRMNAIMAVGTASLYAFLTKISATFHHAKLKTIDWTLSLLFLAGAIPVNAIVARWIAGQGTNEAFSANLTKFITGMVFFCVAMMIGNFISKLRAEKQGKGKRQLSDKIADKPVLRRVLAVLMGTIVGALIGATSIGGGVLIVPMLMILFGLEARQTVGSSIFIAVMLTLVTALSYLSGENSMDVMTAIVMAAGSLVGVPLGSKLSVKLPEKLLQIIVIGIILVAAILMLFNGAAH